MLPTDGMLSTLDHTTLYAVTERNALIESMSFVNTSAATVTVNIWANTNGTPRLISAKDTQLPAGWKLEEAVLRRLSTGDTIEGQASPAGALAYTICGKENAA